MNSACVGLLFASALLANGVAASNREEYPRMDPAASLLARGSGRIGPLDSKEDALINPLDFADSDWAGFIQETQKGAKGHKRYDDVVKKVAAEREVDIDIHSGFGDLEQEDAEEEQWLSRDDHLMPL